MAMGFFPAPTPDDPTHKDVAAATRFTGWLNGAKAAAEFCSAPVLAGLSDTYGRKKIMLTSSATVAVGFGILAYSPTKNTLIAVRLLQGLCDASISIALAIIADISPPDMITKNMGLLGLAFGIGFIVGPVSGGLMVAHSVRLPLIVTAGVSLVSMLVLAFGLRETLDKSRRRPFHWASATPWSS